jgi:hypothetical protein
LRGRQVVVVVDRLIADVAAPHGVGGGRRGGGAEGREEDGGGEQARGEAERAHADDGATGEIKNPSKFWWLAPDRIPDEILISPPTILTFS